jgi:hypothetical protein
MKQNLAHPQKMVICVTFYFVKEKLEYLKKISDHFCDLGGKVIVYIVTNTQNKIEIELIKEVVINKGFEVNFFVPTGLGHPYLLAWSHFSVFRELSKDESISHYMYLEDDILITRKNIAYWMESKEQLKAFKAFNIIPSFLRVEQKDSDLRWYSTDSTQQSYLTKLPRIKLSDNYYYFNLPQPYQGMYLLDKELMLEHLASMSSNPDFGPWGIREKAAQGLTFINVPKGCYSRNFIGYKADIKKIDEGCLIHHTPNNYANNPSPAGKIGTIPVDELLIFDL